MLNILILDEKYEKYEDSVSYSDYISEKDNVGIFLITSPGYISAKDKANCIECVEVEHPISNGMVEVVALELHRKYGIDRVYTNQEEFILRAANIRAMLGLKLGMRIQDALYFRDKLLMKQTCRAGGCPVPEFAQIYSPADILTFTEKFGFPCIIKPTLSCGSLGIRVLKDLGDCHDYLKNEFFAKRTDQELDCPGDWIIESFVNGVMYHVNGYARNGVLEYVWPFAYKNTNLLFTSGEEYGNVSIPTADARHAPLVAATEKILSALKCPDHLVFHCELFAYENKYLLCEIAARKPGMYY